MPWMRTSAFHGPPAALIASAYTSGIPRRATTGTSWATSSTRARITPSTAARGVSYGQSSTGTRTISGAPVARSSAATRWRSVVFPEPSPPTTACAGAGHARRRLMMRRAMAWRSNASSEGVSTGSSVDAQEQIRSNDACKAASPFVAVWRSSGDDAADVLERSFAYTRTTPRGTRGTPIPRMTTATDALKIAHASSATRGVRARTSSAAARTANRMASPKSAPTQRGGYARKCRRPRKASTRPRATWPSRSTPRMMTSRNAHEGTLIAPRRNPGARARNRRSAHAPIAPARTRYAQRCALMWEWGSLPCDGTWSELLSSILCVNPRTRNRRIHFKRPSSFRSTIAPRPWTVGGGGLPSASRVHERA